MYPETLNCLVNLRCKASPIRNRNIKFLIKMFFDKYFWRRALVFFVAIATAFIRDIDQHQKKLNIRTMVSKCSLAAVVFYIAKCYKLG